MFYRFRRRFRIDGQTEKFVPTMHYGKVSRYWPNVYPSWHGVYQDYQDSLAGAKLRDEEVLAKLEKREITQTMKNKI